MIDFSDFVGTAVKAGYWDNPDYLSIEDGVPWDAPRGTLDTRWDRLRAASVADGGAEAGAGYERAGERGGFPHFRLNDVSGELTSGRVTEFGAWGEHHAFGVLGYMVGGNRSVTALIGGRYSDSPPVGDIGTATFRGAMVGETGGKFLSGDSELVYDFSAATIDVSLTGIHDKDSGTYPALHWEGLDVQSNGTFTDTGTIRGSFFGPGHEEVGGIFTRSQIIGAFGAKQAGE